MADLVGREEQSRVVATESEKDLVEYIRQTCFGITNFFKIFMFATCISCEEFKEVWEGGIRQIGSIFHYDIQDNNRFGSLDVYEIQTGGGQCILPGKLLGDDAIHAIPNGRPPLDFHSFPNRTDYIDIHRFKSDFQEAFQHEYHNPGAGQDEGDPGVSLDEGNPGVSLEPDDAESNDSESTPTQPGGYRNARYPRMTMKEVTESIHSRHDPCSPNMKDIEQRMRTFHGWRLNGNWAADKMAEAGFFRTGTGNQAECFHCGFRVYEWDEAPLVVHVRWAPRCRFLRDTFPLDVIYGILFNRK